MGDLYVAGHLGVNRRNAAIGVDVLRGDVQRVPFADIPQERHRGLST
jgi:hypothetical protein